MEISNRVNADINGKVEIQKYVNKYEYDSLKLSEDTQFEIIILDSKNLLTPSRIDIISKIMMMVFEEEKINSDLAIKTYQECLRILSLGKFYEPGNDEKKSFKDFLDKFKELHLSIKKNGFDAKKSYVLLAEDYSILTGTHRTAIAIYEKIKVSCIRFFEIDYIDNNYSFFMNRFLDQQYIHFLIQNYIRISEKNIYAICIWPIANKILKKRDLECLINKKRIIYSEEINLNYNGLVNFISQIYGHQNWIGTFSNGYRGARNKADCCYANAPLRIYFIEGGTLDEIIILKERLRNLFQLGKHSLHITDYKYETLKVSELLLNINSVHFLNYGKPYFNKKNFDYVSSKKNHIITDLNVMFTLYGVNINIPDDRALDTCIENLDFKYDIRNYFFFNDCKIICPNIALSYLKGKRRKICKSICRKKRENLAERSKIYVLRIKYYVKRNIIYLLVKFQMLDNVLNVYRKLRK